LPKWSLPSKLFQGPAYEASSGKLSVEADREKISFRMQVYEATGPHQTVLDLYAGKGYLQKVSILLSVVASGHSLNVAIRQTLTGGNLLTKEVSPSLGDSWIDVVFDQGINVLPGETYYLVLETSSDDVFTWRADSSGSGAYSYGGSAWSSLNAGFCFKTFLLPNYGEAVSPLVSPLNLIEWLTFNASGGNGGGNLKFDVLDGQGNPVLQDLALTDLPKTLTSEAQGVSSLQLKAKFDRDDHSKASPELESWSLTYHADYVNFTVEYESRFEALKRLAELVNAEWWVDAEGKLHFKRERGQDRSAQVKLKAGENLLSLTYRLDAGKLVNRVLVLGAGEGASRVEALEEDLESQSQYGLREAVKVDKEVDDVDSAKTLAKNLLTLHSKPLETVNAVLASTVNFDLGDTVDVVDEELGLDSPFKVKRLIFEFDAEEGETLTVELGYLLPDLKDEILRTRVLERWLK